ncbi:MAG: bacteriohemerythrin [Marinifilaceae bacterium]
MEFGSVYAWKEEYNVGISPFDKAHRQIVDLMNQLMLGGYPDGDTPLLHDVLGEMTNYFMEHIKEEEIYLKSINFPEFDEHKRQHDQFIGHTARFCTQALQRKSGLGREVYNFLEKWFLEHILVEDMKYKVEHPQAMLHKV